MRGLSPIFRFIAMPFLASTMAFGSGSVITNIMPPGGEGATSVALGVALPGGPGSMEVNPALLAWEGERTQSVLQFATSEWDRRVQLFQSTDSPNPSANWTTAETVRSVALRYPVKPGTDVALGYSWHKMDFGSFAQRNLEGDSIGIINSWEAVHHIVLAGRLGGIASVGLGWRWIDSRLAEGWKDSAGNDIGTGTAATWDLGLRLAPTWRVPATPVRITPSLGMSWITVAEDSISYGTKGRDPIERVRRWGGALTATIPDLLAGEVFLDEETDLSSYRERPSLGYEGWSVEALGVVRWSAADYSSSLDSGVTTRESVQYILDAKRLWRLYTRLHTGKLFSSDLIEMDGYPLPSWTVLGVSIAPNIRITWTNSEISSGRRGTVKVTEDRLGWAISL